MAEGTHIHLQIADELPRSDNLSLAVSKSIVVAKKGYWNAVARLEAVAANPAQADDAYIALGEAMNWLDSLAEQTDLRGNVLVQAVLFARQRVHHQWASIAQFDEERGALLWRRSGQLPHPDEPKYGGGKVRPFYDKHLADEPVLEVFRELRPVVGKVLERP